MIYIKPDTHSLSSLSKARVDWEFPFLSETPDWKAIEKEFPITAQMADTPQSKEFHAEGDVWTHTKMVVEELVSLPEWKDLPRFGKNVTFMAALFHDMAKPKATKIENGVISSKGHAGLGARLFRELCWRKDMKGHIQAPFEVREHVANLIMLHALPFYFYDKGNPDYHVYAAAEVVSNKYLGILCEADMKGRVCKEQKNQDYGLEVLDTFKGYCKELECYESDREFPSDKAKVRYFFDRKGSPLFDYYDEPKGRVIIMSGVPGSGKNYEIKRVHPDLPVVGIDETRAELGLKYGKNEGLVLQTAKENAKKHLREGQSFIYNATNCIKDIRSKWIRMFRAYDFMVDCHYVEKSMVQTLANNKNRKITIPERFILGKMGNIEIPTTLEFNNIAYSVSEKND